MCPATLLQIFPNMLEEDRCIGLPFGPLHIWLAVNHHPKRTGVGASLPSSELKVHVALSRMMAPIVSCALVVDQRDISDRRHLDAVRTIASLETSDPVRSGSVKNSSKVIVLRGIVDSDPLIVEGTANPSLIASSQVFTNCEANGG